MRGQVARWGNSVVLPSGLKLGGEILTSHVRRIDTLARPVLPGWAVGPVIGAG